MRNIISTILFTVLFVATGNAQSDIIKLPASQSMCITGKGSGQDGAINPYADVTSIAIIKNIGKHPFEYRVQRDGKLIETKSIPVKKTAVVSLEKGDELYFDSTEEAKAKIGFTRRSNEP